MAYTPTKLPALAFEIFRTLAPQNLANVRGRKLLIACSGGLDSVVLLDVLLSLRKRLDLDLSVVHIHHGFSRNQKLQKSRDLAREFVRALAQKQDLPFFLIEAGDEPELISENDLRKFRLKAFDSLRGSGGFERVALAHHADDLLETRLMRLIRGTGAQGLLSMRELSDKAWRPFLKFPKSRLQMHATARGLKWIEDESNADTSYFRNWIRRTWLPLLEAKRPGGSQALARSLDLLTGEFSPGVPVSQETRSIFPRREFEELSQAEREKRLARLSRALAVDNFGKSKVGEVLKRLSSLERSKQKSASFQVGGLVWKIDPHLISVTKS